MHVLDAHSFLSKRSPTKPGFAGLLRYLNLFTSTLRAPMRRKKINIIPILTTSKTMPTPKEPHFFLPDTYPYVQASAIFLLAGCSSIWRLRLRYSSNLPWVLSSCPSLGSVCHYSCGFHMISLCSLLSI